MLPAPFFSDPNLSLCIDATRMKKQNSLILRCCPLRALSKVSVKSGRNLLNVPQL